jgi:glycosyltransferase involved in cell wall biosynthesis
MRISVFIGSYRRSWALRHSLMGLAEQTRSPDEVFIVLKPSADGSEKVIQEFQSRLPIKVVTQPLGNVTDAVQLAIDQAVGEIILFLDDDAIPEPRWIERYEKLIESRPDLGAICGLTYVGEVGERGEITLTDVPCEDKPTHGPHRKPMRLFEGYFAWISLSGYTGISPQIDRAKHEVIRSADPGGANMAIRKEALDGICLPALYLGTRRGFMYEHILAYYARARGYHIYLLRNPEEAPIVWHLAHHGTLSRGNSFKDLFWKQFDKSCMYWRLRLLGAETSLGRYFLALGTSFNSAPRGLASAYGLVWSLSSSRKQSEIIRLNKLTTNNPTSLISSQI